jgi:photosystem II stability/assembly factor-like uncharacterized protein
VPGLRQAFWAAAAFALFLGVGSLTSSVSSAAKGEVIVSPQGWFETPFLPGYTGAIAPNDDIFVLSESDIFRSQNGGSTFSSLTTPGPSIRRKVVVSPNFTQDQALYLANYGGSEALLISTDAGRTWNPPAQLLSGITSDLAVTTGKGAFPTVFFANSGGGGDQLFITTNNGNSWNKYHVTDDTGIEEIHPSPAYLSDKTLFLVMKNGSLFKIVGLDQPQFDLTVLSPEIRAGALIRTIALSPNYLADQTLFISTTDGFYRSDNGGANWQFINFDEFWQILPSPGFAVDKTVFGINYNDGDVYRSTNSGSTWRKIIPNTYAWNILLSPTYTSDDIIHILSAQGFMTSHDKGNSWTMISPFNPGSNRGREVVILSPGFEDDGVIFVGPGAQEEGPLMKSTDAGHTWTELPLPEPGHPIFNLSGDFQTDQTVFMAIEDHLYKSTNGGTTWIKVPVDLPVSPEIIEVSPNYAADTTLWIVEYLTGILRSQDGGLTWEDITNGAPTAITDLAVSADYPADPTLFMIVYNNGVFRSDNDGNSWTSLGEPSSAPNFRIELSPTFSQDGTVFVGVNGQSSGGAFRSTDRGETWSNITGGVLGWYLPTVAVSPNFMSDQTIIMATEHGPLYLSQDAGDTWSAMPGIPEDPDDYGEQYGVAIGYRDGRLSPIAALNNGVYRYRWPVLTTDLSEKVFGVHEEDPPVIQFDLPLDTDIFVSPYFELTGYEGWHDPQVITGTIPVTLQIELDTADFIDTLETELYLDLYLSANVVESYVLKVRLYLIEAELFLPVVQRE